MLEILEPDFTPKLGDHITRDGQTQTGAAKLIAEAVVAMFGPYGPNAIMFGLVALTFLATCFVPTAALVVFFLFLTGRAYVRHLQGIEPETSCGCFGNLVQRTPAEAFWGDMLLMVPALALAFLARDRGPWPRARLAP